MVKIISVASSSSSSFLLGILLLLIFVTTSAVVKADEVIRTDLVRLIPFDVQIAVRDDTTTVPLDGNGNEIDKNDNDDPSITETLYRGGALVTDIITDWMTDSFEVKTTMNVGGSSKQLLNNNTSFSSIALELIDEQSSEGSINGQTLNLVQFSFAGVSLWERIGTGTSPMNPETVELIQRATFLEDRQLKDDLQVVINSLLIDLGLQTIEDQEENGPSVSIVDVRAYITPQIDNNGGNNNNNNNNNGGGSSNSGNDNNGQQQQPSENGGDGSFTTDGSNSSDDNNGGGSTSNQNLEIIIIVAIVVACLAFALLIFAVIWAWRSDRKDRNNGNNNSGSSRRSHHNNNKQTNNNVRDLEAAAAAGGDAPTKNGSSKKSLTKSSKGSFRKKSSRSIQSSTKSNNNRSIRNASSKSGKVGAGGSSSRRSASNITTSGSKGAAAATNDNTNDEFPDLLNNNEIEPVSTISSNSVQNNNSNSINNNNNNNNNNNYNYPESVVSEDISSSLTAYYKQSGGGMNFMSPSNRSAGLENHHQYMNDAASMSSMDSYGYSLDGYAPSLGPTQGGYPVGPLQSVRDAPVPIGDSQDAMDIVQLQQEEESIVDYDAPSSAPGTGSSEQV